MLKMPNSDWICFDCKRLGYIKQGEDIREIKCPSCRKIVEIINPKLKSDVFNKNVTQKREEERDGR